MSGALVPLVVFAVAFGAVVVFARRNRLLGTLAVREATRRPGQTALVVGGLMIGTATITAALVAADSVGASTVDAFAYRNWGHVDITVDANTTFFPRSVAESIAADPAVRRATDGVAAGIELVGSAANLTRKQGASGVTIVGFDPSAQRPFGAFTLTDGRRTFGEDLKPGEVLVSRTLAEKIDARRGDDLRVALESLGAASGGPSRGPSPGSGAGVGRPLVAAGVARSEGPGAYTLGAVVFAPLETLQPLVGRPGINVVRVSAHGGIRDSLASGARALPAVRAAAAAAGSPVPVQVRHAKAREVDLATESTTFIRAMLVGMSAIVVAAGAALMVNITGMLAEERRTRLGVLRALGLKRRRIVGLSVIEGAIYALAAGVAGSLVGVAAGRLVASRFGRAFAEFAGENFDFTFFFELKPATLVSGFAIGSVLTLLVIYLASRRTSRMTITAAIRNLPEPPREPGARRWPRIARLAIGGVVGALMLASREPMPMLVGSVFLVMVAAALLRARMSPRLHASLTGIALAAPAFTIIAGMSPETDPDEFFGVFVVAMVTSVFGLTILATANLHMVETTVGLLGRAFSGLRAMLRPPLAYLSRRPVRTGLTTGVFSLIIAMLTLFAIFLVVFKPSYEDFGSGYDVRVLSTGTPSLTLPQSVAADAARTLSLRTLGYVGPITSEDGFNNAERMFVPIFATPASAGRERPLRLEQRDERYDSDEDAWAAVLRDPRLIITNFGTPGLTLTLRDRDGREVAMTVAGTQAFGLLDGIFAGPALLERFQGAPVGATMLVALRDGVDATRTARAIEAALFEQGVDADAVQALLDQAERANRAFFSTIDILMRMGLVVGILSLGIVGLRIVTERRHVIGVLRAIGYKRRQVMAGLITEAAVTATIGVVVGAAVGTLMGWIFHRQDDVAEAFGIDWAQFGGVLAIVYLATFLVTLGPAWRASKLPPAEAVRYSE